jgi:hypothetical protein
VRNPLSFQLQRHDGEPVFGSALLKKATVV